MKKTFFTFSLTSRTLKTRASFRSHSSHVTLGTRSSRESWRTRLSNGSRSARRTSDAIDSPQTWWARRPLPAPLSPWSSRSHWSWCSHGTRTPSFSLLSRRSYASFCSIKPREPTMPLGTRESGHPRKTPLPGRSSRSCWSRLAILTGFPILAR